MRARAKTINFATIFGQGAFALSRQLKIEHAEAKAFIETYFERFAGVRKYLDDTVAQARDMIANGMFTLLISDVGLPDGTGFDVIGAFREKSDAPAIAMSGYGMETDLAHTQAAGFAEHLVKPISAESLREMLTRFSVA